MSEETKGTDLPEEEYEADIITLEDETGKEHSFEVLDAAEMDGVRYLAVVPYDTDPAKRLAENSEMLIMRIGEENGQEYLDLVDDEEELFQAGQMFISRLSEVYNIDLNELEQELGLEEDSAT